MPEEKEQSESAVYYNDRACAYLQSDKEHTKLTTHARLNLALKNLNRAIELNPNDSMFYYHRGIASSRIKLLDDAIADFKKSIILNKRGITYYELGKTYLEQNNHIEACKALLQAWILDHLLTDEIKPKLKSSLLIAAAQPNKDFLELAIDPLVWFEYDKIEGALKTALLTELIKVSSPTEAGQNIYWQALLPNTLLGQIFYRQRGHFSAPSISSSGSTLNQIANILESDIKHFQPDMLLNSATINAILKNSALLEKQLNRSDFPNLYQWVSKNILNQDIIPVGVEENASNKSRAPVYLNR